MTNDAFLEIQLSSAVAFKQTFGEPYRRKFTPAARVARPLCVCCQKPYGQRDTETTREVVTSQPAPYRGNAFMVEEELIKWGMSSEAQQAMLMRTTWDGESYVTPYTPFCTLRCALRFGRQAYRAGWRP